MNLVLFITKKYALNFSKGVRSIFDGRLFHNQELLRHRWQDVIVFEKHPTEDAKWREDASKHEGRLCVVNQLNMMT